MNEPVDVATAETVTFLTRHLAPAAQLMEVGCGEGRVAQALQRLGYGVVGIDADEEAVARAINRGSPVVKASWPDFSSDLVDAVAFTRSLHHVGALQPAVRKARDTLKPNGKLLVEDFAFDAMDVATIRWFVELVRKQDLVSAEANHFFSDMIQSNDPAAIWQQHHQDHQVHSSQAMLACISDEFSIEETASVPYLYRYLIPVLPATRAAVKVVQRVLREEAEQARTGHVSLIGRRIVATVT